MKLGTLSVDSFGRDAVINVRIAPTLAWRIRIGLRLVRLAAWVMTMGCMVDVHSPAGEVVRLQDGIDYVVKELSNPAKCDMPEHTRVRLLADLGILRTGGSAPQE